MVRFLSGSCINHMAIWYFVGLKLCAYKKNTPLVKINIGHTHTEETRKMREKNVYNRYTEISECDETNTQMN